MNEVNDITEEQSEKLSPAHEEFKDRLIKLRKERGLTMWEMADTFGLKRSTYAGYESNEGKRPKYETLVKFADYFDVSTDYLIGRTDEKKPVYPVFVGDNYDLNFQKLYDSSPDYLKPIIAGCFKSFYELIYDDVKDERRDRLMEYDALLEALSYLRIELKEKAAQLQEASDFPLAVTDLIELQERLSSRVKHSLNRLLQSDLRLSTQSKEVSKHGGEMN